MGLRQFCVMCLAIGATASTTAGQAQPSRAAQARASARGPIPRGMVEGEEGEGRGGSGEGPLAKAFMAAVAAGIVLGNALLPVSPGVATLSTAAAAARDRRYAVH